MRVPERLISMLGKMRLSTKAAVEIDFHVYRTLELFEDDVVHAAAGVHKSCGHDGERAALFHISRCGEKRRGRWRALVLRPPAKYFARRRSDGVVGAAEARDGNSQQDAASR